MDESELNQAKLERVKARLFQAAEYIGERVVAWENYLAILDSKRLLQIYSRKWSSLNRAIELGFALAQGVEKFNEQKSRVLAYIQTNNPMLGAKIANFSPSPEESKALFIELLAALNNDKAFAYSYIKTHAMELIALVDKATGLFERDKLRNLIIEISGIEIDELNICIGDLERWHDFRIGNNIMFFWNRVIIYLRGGKLEKQTFRGLVRYFKDKSFINPINESYALRSLLTYQRQVGFFTKWMPIIKASILRDEWQGFKEKNEQGNAFYPNILDGENFVKLFRGRFGNKDFADRMEALYADETPEAWDKLLNFLYMRLTHPSYQNAYVIAPASQDLIAIFKKRKGELELIDINAKMRELHDILQEFHDSVIRQSKNLKSFGLIVSTEFEILQEETEQEKKEIGRLLAGHGGLVLTFVEEQNQLILSGEIAMDGRVNSVLRSKMRQLEILKKQRGIRPAGDGPKAAISFVAAILGVEEKIDDIQSSVESEKLSALNALRETLVRLRESLGKLPEIIQHIKAVDLQLDSVKSNYFPIKKNGEYLSIFNSEYLQVNSEER
ncbi:hypothetical protein HYY71_00150 [Candidatus Woesearchaeota archaeon]|nr:hypothetical protein [Candidatus Woesearchaeota archaeon]